MTVEFIGRPNLQRFAETWAALVAAREGLEVVSVTVERRQHDQQSGLCERVCPKSESADL